MTRDELAALINGAGMDAHREGILEWAVPCLSLSAVRDKQSQCDVGASKLGGDPDLPEHLEWPTSPTGNLYFLAQFRLSSLPKLDGELGLPDEGMLYFFYDLENQPWGFDPKDRAGHVVLFFASESDLRRRTPPEEIEFDDGVLECHIQAFEGVTLSGEHCLPDTQADFDAYWEYLERYPQHQLLGAPHEIQNPMEIECQLASNGIYVGDSSGYTSSEAKELEQGADDWILLFQFDSDDSAGVMWGDMGTIYYWIRKQDLATRSFDRAWLVLQCG